MTIALATASYYLIEYPSQLLAQRISRFLAAQEKKGPGSLARFTCMEKISMRKQDTAVDVK
jgi:peptidoglycan/LPS O-acetylase OafA/YrhL